MALRCLPILEFMNFPDYLPIMKTLILLRHAKSSHANPLQRDKARTLNARGRSDCLLVAEALAARSLRPDFILCSSADRAYETVDLILDGLGKAIEVRHEEELYLAEPATVLAHAQGAPESASTLMLVGHNPGLGALAFAMAGRSAPAKLAAFPTAAVATFLFEAKHWTDLDPTQARLAQFFSPKDLKSGD